MINRTVFGCRSNRGAKAGGIKRQEQCSHTAYYAHLPRDRSCPSTPLEVTGSPTNHARDPRHSPLQAPPDPHQRPRRQSIHIGNALGSGFVQSIFRPPPRRPTFECFPSGLSPRRWSKNALHFAVLRKTPNLNVI